MNENKNNEKDDEYEENDDKYGLVRRDGCARMHYKYIGKIRKKYKKKNKTKINTFIINIIYSMMPSIHSAHI